MQAESPAAAVAEIASRAVTDRACSVGLIVTDPDAVAPAVAAGVSVLVVEAALATHGEVIRAAAGGAAVVIGGTPDAAGRAAATLVDRGASPDRVLVEVVVPAGTPVELADRSGTRTPALAAALGSDRSDAGWERDAGWEIGVLTRLLSVGVRTVRGADPVRFRRVRTVVEAIDGALGEGPPGGRSS